MAQFTTLTSRMIALPVNDIDTDQIIPAQFLKVTDKNGLADVLFYHWRYNDDKSPKEDFIINKPESQGAQILLAGDNFGCGSSREHAVWALHEYGIRAVIAPTFSPIFFGNCIRNGIVPVRLPAPVVAELAAWVEQDPASHRVTVDLEAQTVSTSAGASHRFELDDEPKAMLLEGLDAIDLTLKQRPAIEAFRARDRAARPWIYLDGA